MTPISANDRAGMIKGRTNYDPMRNEGTTDRTDVTDRHRLICENPLYPSHPWFPSSRRRRRSARRGSALVETALTILIFVTLISGLFDFGLLVLKHHLLAQAARQLARQAIVHGDLATELGTWGPGTVNVTASDAGEIGTIVRDSLVLIDPGNVSIQVIWLGGNSVQDHDRVRVTLVSPEQLIVTQLFGSNTFNLTASSTMPIAH